MCQVSQPMVRAGTGSGSGTRQSGRQRPSASGRTVQLPGAGSHRQAASSMPAKWCSNSAQALSSCPVSSSALTVVTAGVSQRAPARATRFPRAFDAPPDGRENGAGRAGTVPGTRRGAPRRAHPRHRGSDVEFQKKRGAIFGTGLLVAGLGVPGTVLLVGLFFSGGRPPLLLFLAPVALVIGMGVVVY